jgi:hypothetical protein
LAFAAFHFDGFWLFILIFWSHCSFKIYNEEIRDLLGDSQQKLEVKEHPDQGVYVAGLGMHICHGPALFKDLFLMKILLAISDVSGQFWNGYLLRKE